jgi:undecaprenyl diphosphate synthase
MTKRTIPNHVGFIPDGNRRWALAHGLPKEAGYEYGIDPQGESMSAQFLSIALIPANITCSR